MKNVPGGNAFDIQEKLKTHRPAWTYKHEAAGFQKNSNHEFCSNLIDGIEFAIYERQGNYFILVDFFKSYDDAREEAKNILDAHPDIKNHLININHPVKGETDEYDHKHL